MFVIREEQMDAFSRPIQHCSEKSVDETETVQEEYLHVKILDGADDKYVSKTLRQVKQYVNIEKSPRNKTSLENWLELPKFPVDNIHRLGRVVRVKVRLTTDEEGENLIDGDRQFEIKMIGKNGNVTYNGETIGADGKTEKERSASHQYGYKKGKGDNFTEFEMSRVITKKEFKAKYKNLGVKKLGNKWKEYYGNAKYQFTLEDNLKKGEKILYFRLTAAGGNRYCFLAEAKTSNGSIKFAESVEIETCRCIFYQLLTMENLSISVSSFIKGFEEHAIKLIGLEKKKIPHMDYIVETTDNKKEFYKNCVNKYNESSALKFEPYVVAIALVDQIDRDNVAGSAATLNGDQTGFIYCETQTENGKTQTENGETQTENGETQTENGETQTENGETQTENGETQTENGELTKTRKLFDGELNRNLIHELSHVIGMVPDGSDLNKSSDQYEYEGSHCHYNLNKPDENGKYANDDSWGWHGDRYYDNVNHSYEGRLDYNGPQCVMSHIGQMSSYHLSNNDNYHPKEPNLSRIKTAYIGDNKKYIFINDKFCKACRKAVRKTDLSNGWKSLYDFGIKYKGWLK